MFKSLGAARPAVIGSFRLRSVIYILEQIFYCPRSCSGNKLAQYINM